MGVTNPNKKLQMLYDELYAVVKVIDEVPEYADALTKRKEQIELDIEKLENEIYR